MAMRSSVAPAASQLVKATRMAASAVAETTPGRMSTVGSTPRRSATMACMASSQAFW